ncbi:MAG: AMP-binding protein [Chloroflexi bacterium]|nr:AMP-binding protein [Chloroflexota bacterium]
MPEGNMLDPKIEAMPRAEREKYQGRLLHTIVRHAYEKAPGWKKRLDQAGVRPADMRTVKDIESLPIIRKDDIVRLQRESPPFGGLLAAPPEKIERVAVAPGPIYLPLVTADWKTSTKAYYGLGFRKGYKAINTFSYMYMASWGGDTCMRRIGVAIIPTGVGNTELQVQIMRELQVEGFAGTPSFLLNIIRKAEDLGFDFRKDFRLKVAMLSAEKFTPALKQALKSYGLTCQDLYGTAEGHVAFECEHTRGYHMLDENIWEVVDPKTGRALGPGEQGELVATALSFKGFPLLRFGTGDLAYYMDDPCPCGRTSYRIGPLLGRVEDTTKVRGAWVFPRQVEEVMARFPQVSRFQAVVTRQQNRDFLTVKVEAADTANRDNLSKAVADGIQDLCRLKVDKVEFVGAGTIPADRKTLVDERPWE